VFYLDKGTYLRFLVINAEVHLVGIDQYPQDAADDETAYLGPLNRDFLYMPNWEAVGATAMLEYRADKNTVRLYVPEDVFYDFKKVMKKEAWEIAKKRFPVTSYEYNEMPTDNFPDLVDTTTFTRNATGQWIAESVPVGRALFSSVTSGALMNFSTEIMKLADMLADACSDGECHCGDDCKCGGEGNCGCETKKASWYDEGAAEESAESNGYEASNWYEDDAREAGDHDDDEVVEGLRKKTPRSKSQDYRNRRKRERQNPAARRRKNRNQRRERKKGPAKTKAKRYRKRTKNSPRSKRRAPKSY